MYISISIFSQGRFGLLFRFFFQKLSIFQKKKKLDVFHLRNHLPELQDGYFDPLDRYKNSKKKFNFYIFIYFYTILLINLS